MKTYKWTEQQKKALRGSIRKWAKIVNGTGVDDGCGSCPCCQIWAGTASGCVGCPISEFTGVSGCHDTPHDAYDASVPSTARAELHFLRAVHLAGGGK